MFFLATARVRERIQRAVAAGVPPVSRDMVVTEIQRITLAQLEGRIS
jgi:hypothetical protein